MYRNMVIQCYLMNIVNVVTRIGFCVLRREPILREYCPSKLKALPKVCLFTLFRIL